MINYNKIFSILFLIILLAANSTIPVRANAKNFNLKPAEDTAKTSASTLINGLKNGALLVRLKTSENLINKLNEKGRTKEAEQLKIKQLNENKEVYKAFKEKYKFGKVYFFYSTNTEQIKTGKFAGILLDSNLTPDSSITINPEQFYVAEIGDIHSETTNSSRQGLRVMDAKMNEIDFGKFSFLKSVWEVDMLKLKLRKPADMVEIFDKRLHNAASKL